MSEMECVPNTLNSGDLSEQVRQSFQLAGDPYDQLVLEVTREVDRHQDILALGDNVSPKDRSTISKKRADIVKHAYDMLVDRRERMRGAMSAQKVAVKVLQVVKEVLVTRLGREHAQAILDDVVSRLSSSEKKVGWNGQSNMGLNGQNGQPKMS